MTKQEIIDMMYERNFTFNMESKNYGEPTGLHFMSEVQYDRRHRNVVSIPSYRCSVYPETEEFEFSYTSADGKSKLWTPKCNSFADEDYFDKIADEFDNKVSEAYRNHLLTLTDADDFEKSVMSIVSEDGQKL